MPILQQFSHGRDVRQRHAPEILSMVSMVIWPDIAANVKAKVWSESIGRNAKRKTVEDHHDMVGPEKVAYFAAIIKRPE